MTANELGPDVRALIDGPVSTRMHADTLATLRRPGAGPWTPVALATAIDGVPNVVHRCLAELASAGLVEWTADGRCRYAPASTELRRATTALLQLHDEHPDALVRALLHRQTRPRSGSGTTPARGRAAFPLVHGAP